MGLIHISGQVKLGMSLSVSSLFWTEKTYTSLVLEREQCPEYLLFRLRLRLRSVNIAENQILLRHHWKVTAGH